MSDLASETNIVMVIVSCGTPEEAETIAKIIVTERLAACVNLLGSGNPIKSFYIWENQLQQDSEFLLLIKTRSELVSELQHRILELHSYTTPELIALPITQGSKAYLDWVLDNTR